MPYRRRRRRRRRRRYRRSKTAMTIARGPLFGKRRLLKLRSSFSGQIQVVPNGGPAGEDVWQCITFSANGAAKPNVFDNHLPAGFANVAPLFEDIYTLSSKIHVNFLPSQTAHSAIPWVEKSAVSLNGSIGPTAQQVLDNRYVSWGLSPQNPGGGQKISRTMKFSTKKWFTVDDVTDNSDLGQKTLTSTPAAPARQAYYNVSWVTTHPTVSGTQSVDVFVVLDYIVLLCTPINVT